MIKNKVLVYLQDETLREKLTLLLEGLYDLKVTTVIGLEGVLRSLDRSQYIAHIYSPACAESHQEEKHSFYESLASFGRSFEFSESGGLKKFFGDFAQVLSEHKITKHDFSPVSLSRLDSLLSSQGHHPELFVKLKSGRFVKVHPGGEYFEQNRIEEFRQRGVSAFYLKSEDFARHIEKHFSDLSELLSLVNQTPSSSTDFKKESALIIHQKLMRGIRDSLQLKLRIPEYILEQSSEFLESLVAGGPLQVPWFDRLKDAPEGSHYIERLGMLSAHFGCWILSHSPYNEKKWFEKFVTASLIMDLSLQDEKMARVRVVHEGATTIGVLQAMTIKEHPQRSLELAETLLPVNQDVVNLVELHHERFDGTGFPRKRFISQIPSVTRLFILASMCADAWIESENREDFKKFLEELAENQSLRSLHELLSKLVSALKS